MTYKILFVTDVHLRLSTPISRTDRNFSDTLFAKLEEVLTLSGQADIVIFGGDIFQRPDTPHSLVIRTNRIFSRFKVPLYTVVGNHDIYGYEGLTVDTTAMGSLLEMGSIKRLDSISPIQGIEIYGMHAYDKEEWMLPASNALKILVAHKPITPIPIPEETFITPESIAGKTNADIILSGDIHSGHNLNINGKHFVNPGSLARLTIGDRERYPEVAMIGIDKNHEISVDIKTIPSKPAEMMFDLRAYSNKMASRAHNDEFMRTYINAIISVKADSTKIDDALISFLEKNGVADKMRKVMFESLSRAHRDILKETAE